MSSSLVFPLIPLLLLIHGIHSFNVDLDKPLVLLGPSSTSLFGYSLALHNKTLFVGAPAHNSKGALFKCDFDPTKADRKKGGVETYCEALNAQQMAQGSSTEIGDFMGASLAMWKSTVFACAPRTKADRYKTLGDTTGSCFQYDVSQKQQPPQLRQFFTLPNPYGKGDWKYFTMMGHSIVTTEEGNVVIGTPMASTLDLDYDTERHPGHFVMSTFGSSNAMVFPETHEVLWGQRRQSSVDDPHTFDLTGSAIARGRFSFTKKGRDYALGAPKANKLKGRVYVCPDCFDTRNSGRTFFPFSPSSSSSSSTSDQLKLEGVQYGSRFGEAVCAVDLDGDEVDDLLVGAPLFSEQGLSDVGAVYVYQTKIVGSRTTMELVTSSLRRDEIRSSARFGAALANLGDLDGDGFQDFAVGAPFAGEGAVYVYRGSANWKLLLTDKPQVITPEKLGRAGQFLNFGFSFSQEGTDTDGNGRPDFAVGSLKSDRAVILRAREVVHISPQSFQETPPKAVNPASNEFTINITVKLQTAPRNSLNAKITFINLDDRIVLPKEFKINNSTTKTVPSGTSSLIHPMIITSGRKNNFGVNLDDLNEIPRPIRFFVQIDWTVNVDQCPPLGCALIDPRSRNTENLQFQVPLQTGCEDSNSCKCDLEVLASSSSGDPVRITVGEDTSFTTKLTVKNNGREPSYDASLVISSPDLGIELPTPREMECQRQRGDPRSMTCRFPNLNSNQMNTFDISYDIRTWNSLPLDLDSLDIKMKLQGRCDRGTQKGRANMEDSARVQLDYKSKIDIISEGRRGDAKQQLSYNDTDVKFQHLFRVRNSGPSPVKEDFVYRIFVPRSDVIRATLSVDGNSSGSACNELSTGRFYTDLPGASATTGSGGELVSCSTHNCRLFDCSLRKGFPRDGEVSVVVDLDFLTSKAAARGEEGGVNRYWIQTLARRMSSSDPREFAFLTTELFSIEVSLAQVVTQYLPYAVGVVIGLLLLVVVGVVLWKSNTFSKFRIFKDKLEVAENEQKKQLLKTEEQGQQE